MCELYLCDLIHPDTVKADFQIVEDYPNIFGSGIADDDISHYHIKHVQLRIKCS